jgi:hypothetical protein
VESRGRISGAGRGGSVKSRRVIPLRRTVLNRSRSRSLSPPSAAARVGRGWWVFRRRPGRPTEQTESPLTRRVGEPHPPPSPAANK